MARRPDLFRPANHARLITKGSHRPGNQKTRRIGPAPTPRAPAKYPLPPQQAREHSTQPSQTGPIIPSPPSPDAPPRKPPRAATAAIRSPPYAPTGSKPPSPLDNYTTPQSDYPQYSRPSPKASRTRSVPCAAAAAKNISSKAPAQSHSPQKIAPYARRTNPEMSFRGKNHPHAKNPSHRPQPESQHHQETRPRRKRSPRT